MHEEKVKTGIPGLDEILHGGIPTNQIILISGTTGTGKTTLCSQFCYNGAKDYNENCVFLSLEEPANFIRSHSKLFGWDFEELEKNNKVAIIKYDPYRVEDIFDILDSKIREIKAKRVVVDSVSALGIHVRDKAELRNMIFNLSTVLRKLKCTTLLVSEIVPGKPGISRYGVEEFVVDGVIVMYYERIQSSFNRAIQVWKLRGSSHSEKLHPYTITSNGIEVSANEEAIVKRGFL
ncbi:MAG: ATPase domain-containing protein [Nanoarchaeota archaeon]